MYKKGIKRVWYIYKMIYTIYKISIAGEDYIGSTKDLKQRKGQHKSSCNNPNHHGYNSKIYTTIRANGGWDCCEITPVEEFECETKRQAECREEYWRREYKASLNMKRSFRTEEEEKEQVKITTTRANNKYNEKSKQELPTECECGGRCKSRYKSEHLKSKRHQEFISSNSE